MEHIINVKFVFVGSMFWFIECNMHDIVKYLHLKESQWTL
jgi:hypothetical protein